MYSVVFVSLDRAWRIERHDHGYRIADSAPSATGEREVWPLRRGNFESCAGALEAEPTYITSPNCPYKESESAE